MGLRLFPEQIKHLEKNALPSISWRQRPPPRMADVRKALSELEKALGRVERVYERIYMLGTHAMVEAASRLDMAQDALGFDSLDAHGMDRLRDCLETETNIVRRALGDLPKQQRRTRLDYPLFVRKILWDLQHGHAEHFMSQGKPIGEFQIKVARKKPPFPSVVEIVSEASGGWSADDAIEAYLQWYRENKEEQGRVMQRLRKRH